MYEYLRGIVKEKKNDSVILEINDIGYLIYVDKYTYNATQMNETVVFYIYYHVSENEQSFYGFKTNEERQIYLALISVSGIGVKTGIKYLSETPAFKIAEYISNKRIDLLSNIKGLGEKKAEKIVLELKGKELYFSKHLNQDKNSFSSADNFNNTYQETLLALKNLGYKQKEIILALEKVFEQNKNLSLEEAIKKTLTVISKF